jgi:hypothetical protein
MMSFWPGGTIERSTSNKLSSKALRLRCPS